MRKAVSEGTATVTFTCPPARDAIEVGGQYALYTAPAFAPDGRLPVTCTAR